MPERDRCGRRSARTRLGVLVTGVCAPRPGPVAGRGRPGAQPPRAGRGRPGDRRHDRPVAPATSAAGEARRVPTRAGRGVAAGPRGPAGRPARPGVPHRGRMGSGDPGAVAARPASAAGPHAVSGAGLPGHRARHQDRRVVLALLDPAVPGGYERRTDRLGGRVAGAGGPPGRMRGSRLPADVAGWTVQAAELGVPRAFPAVAPHPGGADGAVPDRPGPAPLPALGPCEVAACTRRAESEAGYCPTHYVRWRTAVTADPRGSTGDSGSGPSRR